jgi:hypothetical protein
MPINLSADSVGDSVYLSFFYQPQGNGFYPSNGDSLMLFFKNKFGDFVKVWACKVLLKTFPAGNDSFDRFP